MDSLIPGLRVLVRGNEFEILSVEKAGNVVLTGKRHRGIVSYTYNLFMELFKEGSVALAPEQAILLGPEGLPPIPSMLNPNAQKELSRRQRYIQFLTAYGEHVPHGEAFKTRIREVAALLEDQFPPSRATVYRWLHLGRLAETDPILLAPRHHRKGRRTGQVTVEVMRIFFDAADKYFLTPMRMSKRHFHQIFVDQVIQVNAERERKNWFKLPSYAAVCRWLSKKIDAYILLLRRRGKAYADRVFRSRGKKYSAQFPLERVEIDHTLGDILIRDERDPEVLFRPWITVAICRRTRMIVGLYISRETPSQVSVLHCLVQGMRSKEGVLREYGVSDFAWPAYGRIVSLVMDNGPDFHGSQTLLFAENFNINIEYCAPRHPEQKGGVERFMGTLNWGVIHELPGTTNSNPKERGDYPSKGMATLSLAEFKRQVFRWVVIEYHHRHHSELGESPLSCWNRLIAESPVIQVSSGKDIELTASLSFKVAVKGGVVRIRNLFYTHGRLSDMQFRKKVTIRINPDNVKEAYLADPSNQALLTLRCINPGVDDEISWQQFQQKHKESRQKEPESDEIRKARVGLILERFELNQRAEKNYRKTKGNKAKAFRIPDSKQIVRNIEDKFNFSKPEKEKNFKEENIWNSGNLR